VENKKKNRYPDKLPYDHNRVLLNALINGSNSDYINASTVVGSLWEFAPLSAFSKAYLHCKWRAGWNPI
jgi:protein tyrosine phosphatase